MPLRTRSISLGDAPQLSGEFHAWLVRAVSRANSEQIPSSKQIPGKHPIPLSFYATNLLGGLTARNNLALGVKPTMRETQQNYPLAEEELHAILACVERGGTALPLPHISSVPRLVARNSHISGLTLVDMT